MNALPHSFPFRRPLSRRSFLRASLALLGTAAVGSAGALTGCAGTAPAYRVVVDSIGREVTVPSLPYLHSIFFTSPLAQVYCYTLAPDLTGGTGIRFTDQQLAYLPVGFENLPYLGSLANGGSIDTEALNYHDIQAVFSISGVGLTDVNIADALKLQDETGIPALLVDGSFEATGDTYRLLAQCLGNESRAEELAAYCEGIYNRVTEAVCDLPEDERVTYYYAEGAEGLLTEPNSSQHALAFLVAGGKNVAADVEQPGKTELFEVTLSQVQEWDPQVIFTWDPEMQGGARLLIENSPSWSNIRAVRDQRVYTIPFLPFPWCDRPPGINRFLGIQWLANTLYPQYYDVDMVDVTREFFARCYWRDISVAQAQQVLGIA